MSVKLKKIEKEAVLILDAECKNSEHQIYLLKNNQKALERQGSVNTKTRAEVRGGGAKPYRQKGTGHARRGTNRSPLRRGGGVVFGPKYRLFNKKLNKRMVNNIIELLLGGKELYVFDTTIDSKAHSVKDFREAFNDSNKYCLLIASEEDSAYRCIRNFKNVIPMLNTDIKVESVLSCNRVVFSDEVVKIREENLKNGKD